MASQHTSIITSAIVLNYQVGGLDSLSVSCFSPWVNQMQAGVTKLSAACWYKVSSEVVQMQHCIERFLFAQVCACSVDTVVSVTPREAGI